MARYLKGLPPEVVAGERERIQLIEDTRSYLVRLMKYVAFQDGKETGIRLRSGATVRGVLVYCNERQLSLRSPGTSGLRTIDWNDLAFEQIVDFLEFYIQLRTDQGSVAGGAQNTSLRQEVAEDCLRTAVLCEWYGHPDRARRYARRTVDADPGAAARVSRLVPGFVP